MILLVACGIDSNGNVVPLAWGLVPIEDTQWWTWFLQYLHFCFPITRARNHVFISDREKGIAIAVPEVFPEVIHLYCCQHIADNIQ